MVVAIRFEAEKLIKNLVYAFCPIPNFLQIQFNETS